MKQEHRFTFEHYASLAELSADDRALVEAARQATSHAHADYSNFHVGAAARLESGRIITGSNQESEVFPAGLCAERTLLFHQQSESPNDRIVDFAIASDPDLRECYPCGQCRQVLHDVEKRQGRDFRVIMSGGGTATVVKRASDLLPFLFEL